MTIEAFQNVLLGHLSIALLASFAIGVLTSMSPCIVAMMPLVLGYAGLSGGVKTQGGLLLVLCLVLGLSSAFTVLGIVAAMFGGMIGITSDLAPVLLGVVLVAMGLNLMKLIYLPLPGLSKLPFKTQGPGGAYLLGFAFGLAASPCAAPVLGVIVSVAAVSGRIAYGGLMLFAFGLGQGLPLIVLGGMAGGLKAWRLISRYWDYGAYAAGLLFFGVGTYLIFRAF